MTTELPTFALDLPIYGAQLDTLLESNLRKIKTLLAQEQSFTWDNLMTPLECMADELERFWSPLSHLHAVMNSPLYRECYESCLPKLSAYETAIGHNRALYDAIQSIDTHSLSAPQCKIIEDELRNFERSGVALSPEKKQRFEAIETRLAECSNHYENNVLDATQAFTYPITDEKRLSGLPAHALHAAKMRAKESQLPGWVLTLEIPCYLAVMTYADDRALREIAYTAYVTRASDQGPFSNQFDNTPIMDEILALREEKAVMLGYKNYAELSIANKMVGSTTEVLDFLNDLLEKGHSQAVGEMAELQAYAKDALSGVTLAPWDIAYLSEKKRQAQFALSQEDLRPYFPLPKVMSGLVFILKQLYGMHLEEVKPIHAWDPEVQCYQLFDDQHQLRGTILMDLFARQQKRGGAWMDSFQSRMKHADGHIQLPIASLNCNFAKPVANQPPTLSHDELITLFHEFGHCLHHVLTQVDYFNVSGINGVEWDAVELPSQFFENWCWEEEALLHLSEHVETGEPLPKALFEKLIRSQHFQSAMSLMRQLEFSLFDFKIHQHSASSPKTSIRSILNDIRKNMAVTPIVSYNRSENSFTHIFSGGYAAGYYSYKWAEVLSCDAFSRFKEEGVFNSVTGREFLKAILEVGGSRKASEAFEQFRGRKASVDALLKQNGIIDHSLAKS